MASVRLSGMVLPKRFLTILVLAIAAMPMLLAQTVTDGAGNVLYTLESGVIYDATSLPVLTVKGNLVFKGTSESKEDIILFVGSDNLFADKTANAVDADMTTTRFALGRAGFYMPGYGLMDDYLIAKYTIGKTGDLVLVAGSNAAPVASLSGDKWTTGELTAVFYLINEQLQLKDMLSASIGTGGTPTVSKNVASQGTLRRMWNTGDDDFSWDGHVLKRRWNSYDYEEWEFDGRILRRLWYDDGIEYEWDGKILKRRFNSGTEEYEWTGTVLRRRWNTGNDEFTIQGNVVKRMWDTSNDEWEMTGEIPIPVIAMVVFGLYKK